MGGNVNISFREFNGVLWELVEDAFANLIVTPFKLPTAVDIHIPLVILSGSVAEE